MGDDQCQEEGDSRQWGTWEPLKRVTDVQAVDWLGSAAGPGASVLMKDLTFEDKGTNSEDKDKEWSFHVFT